jgi:hypothetical protein
MAARNRKDNTLALRAHWTNRLYVSIQFSLLSKCLSVYIYIYIYIYIKIKTFYISVKLGRLPYSLYGKNTEDIKAIPVKGRGGMSIGL